MKIRKSIKSISIATIVIVMALSILFGVVLRIDFGFVNVFAASNEKYYELTNNELDSLSFRTSKSEAAPKITVLTHGLGGSDYHWSNSGASILTYRDHSLIEQLRNKILSEKNDVVVYTIRTAAVKDLNLSEQTVMESKSDFVSDYNESVDSVVQGQPGAASHRMKYAELEFRNDKKIYLTRHSIEQTGDSKSYSTSADITEIEETDVTKHIILVFDAYYSGQGNDYVYAQLEYALDAISYQYYQVTGVLPTYNLIGHSRGGITNLQYALAHPYNVASLYSMGTPYDGSDFGEAEIAGEHPFLSIAGLNPTTKYKDKEKEYSPGVLDILDKDISNSYMSYWNDHYDYFYNHIEFKPIGSYVTFGFVLQLLMEFVPNDIAEGILRGIMVEAETVIGAYTYLTPKWFKKIVLAGVIDVIEDLIKTYFEVDYKNAWLRIIDNFRVAPVLYEHIGFSYSPTFVIADDLFIDLDSQVALGYKGTKVKVRMMDSFDQISGQNKKNIDAPGVAHNLETQNLAIVDYIVNDIDFGQGEPAPFDYRYTDAGYYITNIRYDCSEEGVLFIPETYNGLPVVGIDSLTKDKILDGNNEYHTYITEIHIPKSIKEISDYAFAGMTKLSKIVFEKQNTVNTFNDGIFMNCSSLTTVENADYIVEIGDLSFYNCKSLLSYYVSDNVQTIGENAFVGCSQLSSFTVDVANPYYSDVNGILFNKAGTELLYYPEGKAGTSYSVPTVVTEVAPFAFYGNNNLITLNLNNVRMIRQYALNECENLANIQAPNLNYVEIGAFDETKWLKSQTNDIVKLGYVLVLYQGTASELSIEDITSIAPMAFANNKTLKTVTLNDGLVNIGDGAFYGCNNLGIVNICNDNNLVFVSNSSFSNNAENRKIYVPQPLKNEYLSNELWGQYEEAIEVHQTNITFEANGGDCDVTTGSVYYRDYLTLPTPNKEGYFFNGWYDNPTLTGEALNEQTPWDSMSDEITLYAKWTPLEYLIAYNTNGGVLEEVDEYYTTEEAVTFAIPTKAGYIFSGWYYDEALTLNAGTGFSAGEVGDKNVYAKWTADTYIVTLNFNDDAKDPASATANSETVTFGQPYTLPTALRNGYIFNGWRTIDGVLYTLENGTGFKAWDIPNDTTLYADWTRKKFYIKVNANGIFSWLGADGFSDEQTPIEYGTQFMTATEIEQAFNPQKISYKEGHKFTYFTLEDGTKFTSWTEIPDLGTDGTIITIEANFTKECNFYIMYNGYSVQSGVNPLQANYGDSIDLMIPNNAPVGYVFKCWKVALVEDTADNEKYLNSEKLKPGSVFNYDYMPDLSVDVEGDGDGIFLEAYFEPLTYTVQFNTMLDGVANPPSRNITYDESQIFPILSTAGRAFNGWYTQSNGGGTCVANSDGVLLANKWNIASDTTLYAKWTAITYTITYHLNGGTYNEGESNPPTYTIDTATFTLVDPVYENHRFMGWYDNPEYTGTRIYSIPKCTTGDKDLYAKKEQLYTLQFSEDGYIYSSQNIQGILGETVSLPNYSNKGYTWSGYEMGASYTITGNRIFYLTEKRLSSLYNNSTGYYEIWTYNQLNSVRNYRASKHKLMTSITMPEDTNWVPIPTFTGTFDGNNYWINKLTIKYGLTGENTTVTRVNYGLFEENKGTIKNLGISQGAFGLYKYTATYSNVPIYCGFIAAKNSGTISYCKALGSFLQFAYIAPLIESISGSICGYNTGRVEYCEVFETGIQLTTGFGGGIVGHNKGGTITHCEIALSNVSCYQEFESDTADGYSSGHYGAVGGIVGYAEGGTISYCDVASNVDVDYNGFSSSSRSLAPELGIIAGRSTSATTYTSNVAEGKTGATNGLNVITWTTGALWWKETHTWDQAQYVGGTVGRYV